MRARNSFRGRRRAVSPRSARRGALAMGMMAATGGFRSQSGIGGFLDALADPVDISSGFFGGVDSLLDDLATPQNDLTFGGGTSVPPTPVYPVGHNGGVPPTPVYPVGHNGGVPPTPVYPAPTTPVPVMPSAALMPPPSRPRRRPAPRPRPMRPRRIQTGFSFM